MSLLYFYPDPKKATYSRLVNGVRYVGEREVCEAPKAWADRRQEVYLRERGRCQGCKRFAPLHERTNDDGTVIAFAGHAAHIVARGMGGARRDDRRENLRWLCMWCHNREHCPKAVPKKVRA